MTNFLREILEEINFDGTDLQMMQLVTYNCTRCGQLFTEYNNIGRWECYQYVGTLQDGRACHVRADHISDRVITQQILEDETAQAFQHPRPLSNVMYYTSKHDIVKPVFEINRIWPTRAERKQIVGLMKLAFYRRLNQFTMVPLDPILARVDSIDRLIRRYDSEMDLVFHTLQNSDQENLVQARLIYGWPSKLRKDPYVVVGPRYITKEQPFPE